MNRISISQRGDFDNTSDPAASPSTGSGENPASGSTPDNSINRRRRGDVNINDERGSSQRGSSPPAAAAAASATSDAARGSSGEASSTPSEAERLAEFRAILPGMPDEELLAMIRENDRASNNNRQSRADSTAAAAMATDAADVQSSVPASPRASTSSTGRPGSMRRSERSSRGSRRSWVPCQPAPSRPGIYRVGGAIDVGGTFNIGTTDEMELEIKRIEAVSQVQDALTEKLGYNLRDSGKYEEMEREYAEGERLLASTGLERREKKLLPPMATWEAPAVSRASMMKKEPKLPDMGDPLPLPLSFGGHEEGAQNGGNGEICLGKFVDTAPDEDEDEQKHELDSQSWGGVSMDSSPMGPYDQVVRCWKCRAGLRVHVEVGLVACPRCRTISPATDVANIG